MAAGRRLRWDADGGNEALAQEPKRALPHRSILVGRRHPPSGCAAVRPQVQKTC